LRVGSDRPPVNGDGQPIFVPSAPWQVRYFLQAQDDPSLLLPAGVAWAPRGPTAALFQQRGFNAREYLLTALGQAAGVCPPVEASLRNASPAGYVTDAAGAHPLLAPTSVRL